MARGLSQAKLAAKTRIHVKLLGRIERGKRQNLTVRTLARLAEGLDVEPYELLRAGPAKADDAEIVSMLAIMRDADRPMRIAILEMTRKLVELGKRKRWP